MGAPTKEELDLVRVVLLVCVLVGFGGCLYGTGCVRYWRCTVPMLYGTCVGYRRAGQVRFEAWVPETLYERFAATGTPKAGWLKQALLEYVTSSEIAAQVDENPPETVHRHRRIQTGTRWNLGQQQTTYACSECGEDLTP